jgi:hypothetical protein
MKIKIVIAILHDLHYIINPGKCKAFSIKKERKVLKISVCAGKTDSLDRCTDFVINYKSKCPKGDTSYEKYQA